MLKKRLYLLITVFLITLAACGSTNEEDATNAEENETENEEQAETEDAALDEEVEADTDEDGDTKESAADSEETDDSERDEEQSVSSSNSDFDALVEAMEEVTEGTATLLFESDEVQSHEMEGLTLSLDAYQLVELKDFHRNFDIPFDEQTDGGVILAKYTATNDSDQDLHFLPTLNVDYVGSTKYHSNYRELIPLEEQFSEKLPASNENLIKAGEELTGYLAYPFGEEQLETILSEGNVTVLIPAPTTEYNEYSTRIGTEGQFTLPLDSDSAQTQAETNDQNFYQDKISAENLGEKEMIEQEEALSTSDDLGDVTVTLDGYQFVDFTPNADEAPRYNDPDNIVVATVKFEIDNQSDEEIGLDNISSRIFLNDGSQYIRNEGMLSPYEFQQGLPAGEQGELLQTFLLDKEMYEKIWKDKEMEIEIGPMRNTDAEDISKGNVITFDLK
ncbi:DUF5068 domain-containing protein [Oceanobacillus sp. CFH 90083]|uniref:DUF5068 domain-containing protein n=1 Tax=Oceanobacillus sp. CFH 90083 TaxID=2592336 RepID=UPI00128D9FE5|nr:DUF5068 domain-containing protein [Oceanobacillus sp. CFH 90083]